MAADSIPSIFIPTTQVFNPDSLKDLSPEEILQQAYVLQYQQYNNIANALNLKESAYYIPTEFVTSQQWFRQPTSTVPSEFSFGFRTVVNFGTLPNAGTKSVPHNITGLIAGEYSWTKIIGTATDAAGNGIQIGFSSPTLNENIKLTADITNVNVTTAIDYTAFTNCYIILEFLKDSF